MAPKVDPNIGITRYEVIPYALPFRKPYVTARGALTQREMVLIRAYASDGIVGVGEAVPLTLRGRDAFGEVVDELRAFAERFASATFQERRELWLEQIELSPPSRCAINTAWIDVHGKRSGLPAWTLEGAEVAQAVECNATLSSGEPKQVAQEALAWADEGFSSFKLKVGTENDVEQVGAVRDAIGPDAKLRIDANGVWNPDEAVAKLARMSEFDLELVEQPTATLEGMAEVRRQVDNPIAADESVSNPWEAEDALRLQACDFCTVKLSKVGGSIPAKTVAGMIPAYLSSALDGPVGIAAAAHTAQAVRRGDDAGLAHGLATQRLFSETIALRECELRDGFLHLPEGPGLGVEIDDAALERHRL